MRNTILTAKQRKDLIGILFIKSNTTADILDAMTDDELISLAKQFNITVDLPKY
jgi:hypothetical protein